MIKNEPNIEPKRRAMRERIDSDLSTPDAVRAPEATIYHFLVVERLINDKERTTTKNETIIW